MHDVEAHIRSLPALQQPQWDDPDRLRRVQRKLATDEPLVREGDVRALRQALAAVARGEALVVQCGDCAEDPGESTAADVQRKSAVLDLVAGTVKLAAHKPVLRVGRIAGQYGKPRSQEFERIGCLSLMPYRGHLINRPEPTPEHRRPEPMNILDCHAAAGRIMDRLGWRGGHRDPRLDSAVWTSHEALVLDYELPLLRRTADSGLMLASTHWPWVGARTNAPDSAHVALLASIANPVACKVGPKVTVRQLLEICARLDPQREPGRLTLISRMGADAVAERLPELVAAVHDAGYPVIWLVDPMHGNTVTTPDGLKTRLLTEITREVQAFQCAVRRNGGVAGGLHLETTPDDVTECVRNDAELDSVALKSTTLCDPRLNPRQAVLVAAAWQG